jgi:hypothetical protein
LGYAALSDSLGIRGEAKTDIPEGLFIVNVVTKGMNNMDSAQCSVSYLPFSTTVDSTVNRKTYDAVSSVTYTITVLNNTKLTYSYRDIYYQTNLQGYAANNSISERTGDRNIVVDCALKRAAAEDKKVAPGDTLEFNVTYNFGQKMDTAGDLKTLINFQFGINVESEEAARDAVHEKFLNILNSSVTYNELVTKLDDKYDGYNEWTSNYIGNVSSAVDADSMTVETLFAGQLNMVINGQTKKARVLIKHENLDNNTKTGDDYVAKHSNGGVFRGYGCEMTLYLTTEELNNANGWATVYVTVFTCDRDENGNIVGSWYKIGETYEGEANVVGYNGENGGTGSFVTDNWRSYATTYSPTEQYSYYVASGTGIKALTTQVDQNAINEFQRLLTESKEIIDDVRYAGIGIEMVEDAYIKAAKYYTLDANGNPVANQGITRAQLLPMIKDLNHAIIEAKEEIENLPKELLE